MITNLMNNLDIVLTIIITSVITAIIILIPVRNRYNIAVAKTETLFRNLLNMIKSNIECINEECANIYSIKRIKGRNDEQRSIARRIGLYSGMILSHINQWNKNNE